MEECFPLSVLSSFDATVELPQRVLMKSGYLATRSRRCEVAAWMACRAGPKPFPRMFSDQREPLRSFQPLRVSSTDGAAMTPQTGPYGGFDMGLYLVSTFS